MTATTNLPGASPLVTTWFCDLEPTSSVPFLRVSARVCASVCVSLRAHVSPCACARTPVGTRSARESTEGRKKENGGAQQTEEKEEEEEEEGEDEEEEEEDEWGLRRRAMRRG